MKQLSDEFARSMNRSSALFAEWRRNLGLSQFELAEIIGCHPNSIQNVERKAGDVTVSIFGRLCVQFGCPGLELDDKGWSVLHPDGTFDIKELPPGPLRPSVMVSAVGAAVQGHRQRAGHTIRELAKRASIHTNTLWNLESGLTDPSISTLYRVYRALDVTRVTMGGNKIILR